MTEGYRPIKRALVSVFNKGGLEALGEAFQQVGTEVVSTGATADTLRGLGFQVTDVSQVTGFPESLGGRVKTLDPHIHAGILADLSNPEYVGQLKELGIAPFDLVIVNLYPFVDTVAAHADDQAAIIEQIDIGGPAMVRAAAKNSATVTVITDQADYQLVAERVGAGQGFNLEERRWFAAKAFSHTASYDAAINQWTSQHWIKPESLDRSPEHPSVDSQEVFPQQNQSSMEPAQSQLQTELPAKLTRTWNRARILRYGENPHQLAALYVDPLDDGGFARALQLNGKPMSYNNFVDADAAWRTVWDFAEHTAVAIVKHNNPCGLALGTDVAQAHLKAHACDSISAYGGVIASNRTVTVEMAKNIIPIFTEVIVAPDYEGEALNLLKTKKKNLRILEVKQPPLAPTQLREIDGGVLVQTTDRINAPGDTPSDWKLVSGKPAEGSMLDDLWFAWRAIRCVKSNAILLAHDQATVGIGMGQVNRVDSCHLAVERANTLDQGRERANGSVAASDAFFPFADGAQCLIDAGVRAIVQPGGSIRDQEVVDAAQMGGITMYMTGTRHFFH